MNIFNFNGRNFSQKQGVAMGTKMGPSVACILMEHLEELFFAEYEHSTPMLCKRCIDESVGAAACPEIVLQCLIDFRTNFNSSIKYTYTMSNNTVTFLDLQLTIDDNHSSILNLQIPTIILYSHPVIHHHANISFHFHKCC